MDWSKAKNIMIISFIIVDIFLVFYYFHQKYQFGGNKEQIFEKDVKEALLSKGIKIEVKNIKGGKIRPLIVKYKIFNKDELNKVFFDDKAEYIKKSEDFYVLRGKNAEISVINGKVLAYRRSENNNGLRVKDSKEALNIADNFMKKYGLDKLSQELYNIYEDDGSYYLEYSSKYKSSFIEADYINMLIKNKEVMRCDISILEPLEEADYTVSLEDLYSALLSILDKNECYNKTITGASMAYYFEPLKQSSGVGLEKADRGPAVPSWRLIFKDGFKYVIENKRN